MSNKTYVYDGKEFALTGRTANKKMPSGKIKTLYEIRPAEADPDYKTLNKWVTMDELYVIEENKGITQ